MADYRIVIPILNYKVLGFVGPPWQLTTEIGIDTVLDEDHAALLRDPPKNEGEQIQITSKVITIHAGPNKPAQKEVLWHAAIAQFCLNYFAVEPGASISWACTMTSGKKNQKVVADFFDLSTAPIAHAPRNRQFKFDKTVKRAALSGMHQASTKALQNFPGAMMTVDRFSRALSKNDKHDRLVDLCICLESLLDGKDELRFRFSQMHAMISERNPARRIEAFKLFRRFYDARSKVVHGDASADAEAVIIDARWSGLMTYARKSLAYYFAFMSDKTRPNWNDHVLNICLGVELLSDGD